MLTPKNYHSFANWTGNSFIKIEHFNCITLIKILLLSAVFARLQLYAYPSSYQYIYIYIHRHNENFSNTMVSQKFCNILIMWDIIWQLQMVLLSWWRGWNTIDCRMLNSPDTLRVWSLWVGAWSWNPPLFLDDPTLLNCWSSYNLSKISWTIWLLYCNQLCLHFLPNKCFWLPSLNL